MVRGTPSQTSIPLTDPRSPESAESLTRLAEADGFDGKQRAEHCVADGATQEIRQRTRENIGVTVNE